MLHLVMSIAFFISLGLCASCFVGFMLCRNTESLPPSQSRLSHSLPGYDCGKCSFATCREYAEALSRRGERLDRCLPGGKELTFELAKIMDVQPERGISGKVARVLCSAGSKRADHEFVYTGFEDCTAAHSLFDGMLRCKSGCLGFGSCVRVCPEKAIVVNGNGLAVIDPSLCTGCGICVSTCSLGLIRLMQTSDRDIPVCSSPLSLDKKKGMCAVYRDSGDETKPA